MHVVIDIPEEKYQGIINMAEEILDVSTFCSPRYLYKAVLDGTPLPKGYGRLGDLDKIANEVNALKDNWNRYGNEYESGRYESYDYVVDVIENAPIIIEADKGDGSDK